MSKDDSRRSPWEGTCTPSTQPPAATEGQPTPPPAGGTDASPQAKKKKAGVSLMARFLGTSREMIQGALAEPQILAAIA